MDSASNIDAHSAQASITSLDGDEKPLPYGWSMGSTPEGRVYFIEYNTEAAVCSGRLMA